jgi:hypothetical protein
MDTLPGTSSRIDRTPPRSEAWNTVRIFFSSFFCQYGASQQWAEPVTGSSFIPTEGAKNRLTKSNPGMDALDVTITLRMGIFDRLEKSGVIFRTKCSYTTSIK